MHLDYRLSEDWDENSTDLATADETDLRYFAATGDIILREGKVDLSARWGWIPLIDFALALREIADALSESESETFEFTESDATIRFDRKAQELVISASYVQGEFPVPLAVFTEQTKDFGRRLDKELRAKRPALGSNPVYQGFKLSGLSD
jgi:hypothetical protein